MTKRYVVKIEYQVDFDELTAMPSEATRFLRDQVELRLMEHEGFSSALGGVLFRTRGKPTVRAVKP